MHQHSELPSGGSGKHIRTKGTTVFPQIAPLQLAPRFVASEAGPAGDVPPGSESRIRFMQEQHTKALSQLLGEIHRLKEENRDLKFRLVMRDSTASSGAEAAQELQKQLDAANAQLHKAQQEKEDILFDLKRAKEELAAATSANQPINKSVGDGSSGGYNQSIDDLRATVSAQEREIEQLLKQLDALSAARSAQPTTLLERKHAHRTQQAQGYQRWQPPPRGHPPRPHRLSTKELHALAAEQRHRDRQHSESRAHHVVNSEGEGYRSVPTEIVGRNTLPSIGSRRGPF